VEHKERTSYINIKPQTIQQIVARLTPLIEKAASLNYQPIVLTSPGVRPYFKRIMEKFFPSLVVLSYNEVTPDTQIKPIGVVSIE